MVELESEPNLEPGDAPPSFELERATGGTCSLSDFEDEEALLIVFTCNHCPYAIAKFDLLNEIAADYESVSVVGINPNDADEYPEDSLENMQELVADGTIAYDAYLRDESQDVAAAYGAVCTPDPFLFGNDDGQFRLVYQGRLDDALNPDDEPTRFYIREAIDAVLDGEDVDLEWQPSRGCSIKWKED